MNSLMNYGSDDDDDYEESGDEKRVVSPLIFLLKYPPMPLL